MPRIGLLYRFPVFFKMAKRLRRGKQEVNAFLREVVEGTLAASPNGTLSVVDLACGSGEMKDVLPKYCSYTGLDLNHTLLREGQGKGRDVRYGDVVISEYPPADIIIMKDLLHHLPDDNIRKVLQKALQSATVAISIEPSYLGWVQKPFIGRIVDWFFTVMDQDGTNETMNWRSEGEFREAYEGFWGVPFASRNGARVRQIRSIKSSIICVYQRSVESVEV